MVSEQLAQSLTRVRSRLARFAVSEPYLAIRTR